MQFAKKTKTKPKGPHPPSQEDVQKRRIVGINPETITDVTSTDFPHHYAGETGHEWSLDKFRENLKVEFTENEPYNACFQLIGVDASIANAFRRIMISEIPTLAIEDVFMYNNTGVIQDEVLCARLGLIPLTGSREGLKWMTEYRKPPPEDDPAAKAAATKSGEYSNPELTVPSDRNTIVMRLQIQCEWTDEGIERAKKGEEDPKKRYANSSVYAHHLTFEPKGQQSQYFKGDDIIRSVHPNILLAQLRPNQAIDLICHCIKGVGSDHAKFSPVATASYRLMPTITFKEPIYDRQAKKFARCFPKGVIKLVEDPATGRIKAEVDDMMKDTVSRECLRHDEFRDKVQLGRIRDHFIFSVESTGQAPSDELFLESIQILKEKALSFKRQLTEITS